MRNIIYFLAWILFTPAAFAVQSTGNEFGPPPNPVIGVKIVSDVDADFNLPKEVQESFALKRKQFKLQGYFETDSIYPRKLLAMKFQAPLDIKMSKKPEDTDLRKTLSEIPLAFSFNGFDFIKTSNILGFAPAGGYHQGWTGFKEFFTDPTLGTCSITLYNIKLSHGGIILGRSSIEYLVNNKPTDLLVEGSLNSGYLYKVSWYDNTFIHDLECANLNFDKTHTDKMLELARKMDHQL